MKKEDIVVKILTVTHLLHAVAVIYCMMKWLTVADPSSRDVFRDIVLDE